MLSRVDEDVAETRRADGRSDEALLADIRRFRRNLHLPADEVTMRQMLADYRAGRQEAGMWETAEERASRQRRDGDLGPLRRTVRAYVEGPGAADVAGRWVSWEDGQAFNVAFARRVEHHRAALLGLVDRPELLRVHAARHSAAELARVRRRLADDPVLTAAGIECTVIGTDQKGNVVRVGAFAPDADAARRLLADRYGDAVRLRWLGRDKERVEGQQWQRWSVDETGRRLTVHYLALAVGRFERVEHDEAAGEVRVTVYERVPAGVRSLAGTTREATVVLAAPLGGRRVVDGTTGRVRERRS